MRYNTIFISIVLALHSTGLTAQQARQQLSNGYPITPVPFTSVKVDDGFWGQRLKAVREVTIPLAFSKCEETGRYRNFWMAAHPGSGNEFKGCVFDDTDVYKTIEGASYSLQTYPDPALSQYIDSVLSIVAAAQDADGYLYTPRTMNPQGKITSRIGKSRWEKEQDGSHELYCLGHMIDGAVAHYQATGKRNFLDIAIHYADCAVAAIGPNSSQLDIFPEHQIAEMSLAKLYLVTGKKEYLSLAKFLLDRRGRNGHTPPWDKTGLYDQSHAPVTEQTEAVGHAVRATYMYSGMADVAALTGDSAYAAAIDKIWDNIVGKKMYITGGIGAIHRGEKFGDNYELPNLTAYNETCAAIGNVYLNQRLFLLHGDAKYIDVMERTLYNGLISGMSIDGGSFFYTNPLAADGKYRFNADSSIERQPWFGCACCPSNLCRFLPSLPGYVYATRGDSLYVNLYMGNRSEVALGKRIIRLSQATSYPWNGDIDITVERGSGRFAVKLRIPGWAQGKPVPSSLYSYCGTTQSQGGGYNVKVNGQAVEADLDKGYLTILRKWKRGDRISIKFDMQPRTVVANAKVKDDEGRVAVECGPLVYQAEFADNDADLNSVMMIRNPRFTSVWRADLLRGVTQLQTQAQTITADDNGVIHSHPTTLTLSPYYAWCHRGVGKMLVWIANDVKAVSVSTDCNKKHRN